MDYKTHIIESGKRMLNSGLTVETWGNISARNPETELIYLTPSGMPYDELVEEDIAVLNLNGEIIEGSRKPSIEKDLHLEIYRKRSEINAVIHTHPVHSTVFAVLHEPIPPFIDEAAQTFGGSVKVAEYALPGSTELAENALRALEDDGMACLLANHGAVCLGKDMQEAFKVSTVLEMTAEIYYKARMIGKPKPIYEDNIRYLKNFMKNSYGQEGNK